MRNLTALVLLFVLCLGRAAGVDGQELEDRKLLAPTYPLDTLATLITPRDEWHPFPTIDEPGAFSQIPEPVREAYISQAENHLDDRWERLPASVFLEFARTGNRTNYERLRRSRRNRLAHLVLGELFEREGRFLDQIVNGIWAISEETFWGVPAHLGLQDAGRGLPDVTDPVVDLFAAETGVLLAWTHYLLESELDEINSLIADRIEHELDRRILTPYLEHTDWWWMGYTWRNGERGPVNNWNPWINSNVLAMALLMEDEPQRRLELVHKAMYSLDAFIEPYPSDGGCDEGPSYWNRAGASLFEALEWLHRASGGAIDIYNQPLIRRMGQYIYRVYISDPYFINFADASAKASPNASIVYRYGKAIGDETMQGFGAYLAQSNDYGSGVLPGTSNLTRVLPALFALEELTAYPPAEPLVRDAWFPDLQVMAARSREGSAEGFYVAAKGGHNAESHNHNDVGNFIVYHDGQPVLIDAGAQTYTAKTFSSQRYELWNNQSAYHNVPTVNGVMQQAGRQFAARNVTYRADDDRVVYSLDMAGAYPDSASVESWNRTITFDRGQQVVISEEYTLSKFVEPPVMNYLTPLEVTPAGDGRLRLIDAGTGAVYIVLYDDQRFVPGIETISIDDDRMSGNWGEELRRIRLISTREGTADQVRIQVSAASE